MINVDSVARICYRYEVVAKDGMYGFAGVT